MSAKGTSFQFERSGDGYLVSHDSRYIGRVERAKERARWNSRSLVLTWRCDSPFGVRIAHSRTGLGTVGFRTRNAAAEALLAAAPSPAQPAEEK